MAKTYTNLTAVATGDVLTATNFNNAQTTLNNHTVPPMCRVYRSAALSQTLNGGLQAVAWDAQSFTNTDGMWSASPNPSRVTIATTGVYLLTGSVGFTPNATGVRAVALNVNGTVVAYADTPASGAAASAMTVSTMLELTAAQYVELSGYQSSGGSLAYFTGYPVVHLSVVFVGKSA
jgi:hypothetical protein